MFNEIKEIETIDINSPLEQIQTYLSEGAHIALEKSDFLSRSIRMATITGAETSLLTAKAFNIPDKARELQPLFTKACTESCMAFEDVFDSAGNVLTGKDDLKKIYSLDQAKAAAIALSHVQEALSIVDIEVSADRIIDVLRKVDFVQVMDLTSQRLGSLIEGTDMSDVITKTKKNSSDEIRASLHKMLPHIDDYSPWREPFMDTISINPNIEQLSTEDQQIVEMSVRLANATWKAHQVHRAAWEGNDDRINPQKRDGVFNPYDLLKKQQYEQYALLEPKLSDEELLIRISWEIMKDVIELQEAMLVSE